VRERERERERKSRTSPLPPALPPLVQSPTVTPLPPRQRGHRHPITPPTASQTENHTRARTQACSYDAQVIHSSRKDPPLPAYVPRARCIRTASVTRQSRAGTQRAANRLPAIESALVPESRAQPRARAERFNAPIGRMKDRQRGLRRGRRRRCRRSRLLRRYG
jgi:hypothetical protein